MYVYKNVYIFLVDTPKFFNMKRKQCTYQ